MTEVLERSWALWHRPVITATQRMNHGDQKFQVRPVVFSPGPVCRLVFYADLTQSRDIWEEETLNRDCLIRLACRQLCELLLNA